MRLALSVCALVFALPLVTQAGGAPVKDESLVRLKVQPAPAPKPALRYQLLPEMRDLEPGNAVLGYLKCFSEQPDFFSYQEEEKRGKWLDMPLKDLPLKEVGAAGNHIRARLDYAARLDHADWQSLLPLRKQGFRLLIPELQQMRSLAVVLLVRLRADLLQRDFDDALVTAKTLLAMARHMGEHPTLIGDLIGIAFVSLTSERLEEMVQQPDCPNLYWALTDLPDPLIDIRGGLQGERMVMETYLDLDSKRPMSDSQLKVAVDKLDRLVRSETTRQGALRDPRGWLTAHALDEAFVRAARARLVALGLAENRVKEFPALQVVLLDDKLAAEVKNDDNTRAFMLPYWQAESTIKANQPSQSMPQEGIFIAMVPMALKVRQAQARIQQRIGMLRCVEALRIFAAENNGRLPARLEEISVPVPIDPVTGRPFRYHLEGATATIQRTPPTGEKGTYTARYEVTVVK